MASDERVVVDLSSDAPPRGHARGASEPRQRPWYKLSLPGTMSYEAFSKPARDPLRCWPDEYDCQLDTNAWACAMDWRGVPGYQCGVKVDTGFEPYTVNYAFNYLYASIPCKTDTRRGGVLVYDIKSDGDALLKQRNFYGMLQYIHHYPIADRMPAVLGFSWTTFRQQVAPALFAAAADIDFMDFSLRLWDYNHVQHFPERVLMSWDGFPVHVSASKNKWVARLTKSKKYQDWIIKVDLGIMLSTGFPLDYSCQLGVRNDSRMWEENPDRRARIYPWEYALGDKAYVGFGEFLTEYKDYGALTHDQIEWNNVLQFYRGRNEHTVSEVKTGRAALDTKWRGSMLGLCSVLRIVIHLVALQERMRGPKYDCFGPWPVCPNAIVARYYRN